MREFRLFKKLRKKLNFKNSVVLYTCGCNLERYLNLLCCKNVKFIEVERLDFKNAKIEVSPIYESQVEEYLNGKNIRIVGKKYNGFSKIQKFFSVRYGILIGLFFAFCFFVISSNYVWNIEVIGNDTRRSDEIISILSEHDVSVFDALNKKTNEEIERIILDNMDEVSMVSVIKKGTTIIINIKEKLLNDDYENIDNHSKLTAVTDGIITSIELIQGTLLVKVGDTVRAGDELVAPYVIDSSGKKIPIEPRANIYANIWLAGESVHYSVKNVVERTGSVLRERKMVFLNKEIYSEKPEVIFDKYETETKETCIGDILFPIKYITTRYYETTIKVVEEDFSTVEKQKIDEARQLAKLRVSQEEKIVSENHVITLSDGKTTVSYVIVVNRKIS